MPDSGVKNKLIKTKIAWIDLETTGVDYGKNEIWQLACLIEQNGKIIDKFECKMAPSAPEVIDPEALKLQAVEITVDYLLSLPPAEKQLKAFKRFLQKHVNKYNKEDKLVPAGYFVRFDLDFLRAAFLKQNDKYFGSWFFSAPIAVETLVAMGVALGLRYDNHKLSTICAAHNIEIGTAHDALADIRATRFLYYAMRGFIGG